MAVCLEDSLCSGKVASQLVVEDKCAQFVFCKCIKILGKNNVIKNCSINTLSLLTVIQDFKWKKKLYVFRKYMNNETFHLILEWFANSGCPLINVFPDFTYYRPLMSPRNEPRRPSIYMKWNETLMKGAFDSIQAGQWMWNLLSMEFRKALFMTE